MSDTVIKVENLYKQYRLGQVSTGTIAHDINRWFYKVRGKEDPYEMVTGLNTRAIKDSSEYVWALQNINFEVKQGEVLGIIGKNGAGKSTLLKILSKVTAPTKGEIKVKGRIASLLEVGTGFHPELTGRENIFLNGAILGMSKSEIRSKFDEIVSFSGVEKYIDTPVKRYSSGMYVRLAFAVAAHLEPEILIVDEVLAVGDAEFQKKCLGKMKDVSNQGRTVLFVSHNMNALENLCDRILQINKGQSYPIQTDVRRIIQNYLFDDSTIQKHQLILGEKYNNFEFALKKIYLTDLQDNLLEGNCFSPFDDIKINIEGDLNKFDNRLRIGFELKDSNHQTLFFSFNRDIDENLQIDENKNIKFSTIIPKHMLNEGEYKLHPWIDLYHLSNINDSENEFINFTIQGKISNSHYYNKSRPGVIAPLLTWKQSKI